jgi:hypothetical protein
MTLGGPIGGLDQPCPTCERLAGDHTLREWSTCMDQPTTDLRYEDLPPDAQAMTNRLRDQLGVDEDWLIADNVVAKSLVLTGRAGVVRVAMPAVLTEFAVGAFGSAPMPVAKALFIGNEKTVRGYGRLLRDTANGAANAAKRAAA